MFTVGKEPRQYRDRTEAGAYLAGKLKGYEGDNPVVVGLPRGGVVVAAEVARGLKAELDVIIAGKLRAPYNPELAIGAITEEGHAYINKTVIRSLNVDEAYIVGEKRERLSAIKEKLRAYRAVKRKVPLKGRTVILVDDGLATGSTMISAIEAAKAEGATRIIAAVPGGPSDTVERLKAMEGVTEVVCPLIPPMFFAVSQLYFDFSQTEDMEVVSILREFGKREAG